METKIVTLVYFQLLEPTLSLRAGIENMPSKETTKQLTIEPQFESLAKKFSSSDNLNIVPITVQNTLADVRRNGETIIQRLKEKTTIEEGFLLKLSAQEPKKPSMMRRSVSEERFNRPSSPRFARAPRRLSKRSNLDTSNAPTPIGQSPETLNTLLTAINMTVNQARAQNMLKFQLPSRESFEQQAKQLVHSASTLSLESVTSQLPVKAREALSTAQQTLDNCSQNFAVLQQNLSQSFIERRATFEQKLLATQATLEHRLRERSTMTTGDASLATAQPSSSSSSPTEAGNAGEGSAFARLFSLTTRLRGSSSTDDLSLSSGPNNTTDLTTDDDDLSPTSRAARRPFGPFQKEAAKRRSSTAATGKKSSSSSLRESGRKLTIVTTAALPWMTGTAVNPLLRAAYLSKDSDRTVTLMVPWLAASDQAKIYPNGMSFETPDQQETYIKDWAKKRTGFDPSFKVTFYPGRYAPEKCSILPVGDPTAYVPDSEADVAILEEPEHLTWYHAGKRWTDKFNHVVGVVHTNYLDYARREEGGETKEFVLKHINSLVTRAHCHRVVKLSDAVQKLPREMTLFVHGVAENFLKVGENIANKKASGDTKTPFTKGAYFIGKAVWAKGYTELLDLMEKHDKTVAAKIDSGSSGGGGGEGSSSRKKNDSSKELSNTSSSCSTAAPPLEVDCFGAGDDLESVRAEGAKRSLKLTFHGARDHADTSIQEYKVFINPSTSDVVATTTAEALAMGKWVVCAQHPSNEFFSQFSNCLVYKTPEEFSKCVKYALSHDPKPLPKEEISKLTWEAATERFLDATELTEAHLRPSAVDAVVDTALYTTHSALCGMEQFRALAGAGTNTKDNPPSITAYEPAISDVGGLFDDKKRAVRDHSKAQMISAGGGGGGGSGSRK